MGSAAGRPTRSPTSAATSSWCLVAAHVEVLDVLRLDASRVGDGGRVEQADQLGEALRVAVVRRGAGEQQRLGARREHPGQLVVERAPVDEVVALVDHHRVPADALEMVAVAAGVLERVDRDDRPLVVGERVAVGGDLAAHPLDALGVEPHQRDGEAGPQLVLELLEDVAGRDDQDPLAAAAADQLATGSARPRASCRDRPRRRSAGAGGAPFERLVHRPALVLAAGRAAGRSATASPVSVAGTGVLRIIASR